MKNRKYNTKRVRDAIIWMSLIAGITALLVFSVVRKSNARIKNLEINIESVKGQDALISEKEVKNILQLAAGKTINASNIKTLNLRKLEAKLNKDKRIERAEIYFDSKNRLQIHIIQRNPLMRIVNDHGQDYYIDHEGHQIPATKGSAVRVPVVTGVRDTFKYQRLMSDKASKLQDVFRIMQYIDKDVFLSGLIEQIHVEQDSIGDIVLIPKVGREKIIFGDATDIATKFNHLKIFYRDGMPKLEWSRYKSINLKYANQVVGMLANPETAKKIMPILRDTLQTAQVVKDNKKQSIHH